MRSCQNLLLKCFLSAKYGARPTSVDYQASLPVQSTVSQISLPKCFSEIRPAYLYGVIKQRHFWGSIIHWLWEVDKRLEACGKLDRQQQMKVFLQLMAGIPEDVIEKRCNDLEKDYNRDLVLYWTLVQDDIIHAYGAHYFLMSVADQMYQCSHLDKSDRCES